MKDGILYIFGVGAIFASSNYPEYEIGLWKDERGVTKAAICEVVLLMTQTQFGLVKIGNLDRINTFHHSNDAQTSPVFHTTPSIFSSPLSTGWLASSSTCPEHQGHIYL